MNENIALALEITNIYEDGDEVVNTTWADVPEPPEDDESEEYEDWRVDHIFPLTGTGRTEGDAAYFVKVVGSSNVSVIPLGTEWEFGT